MDTLRLTRRAYTLPVHRHHTSITNELINLTDSVYYSDIVHIQYKVLHSDINYRHTQPFKIICYCKHGT